MNKNIIIAILVVIIIAAGAALMFGQNGKTDTQINFINNDTIQNGEQVQFQLNDTKGNALSGQSVNITFNGNEKYSITTDQNGKGYLTISGENAGDYDVVADYTGDDKYNGCTAKVKITITDDVADNPATQTTGDAVANTDQYNNNTPPSPQDPDNPYQNDTPATSYFVPQYELWVSYADNTVIAAPNDEGIGLTLDQWIATYVHDYNDTQTN